MSERRERLALNEALFREANERMTAWPERAEAGPAERLTFYCECAEASCKQHLSLTPEEYESVRASSRHFAIVAGHEYPDAERVIESHDRYVVIEKAEDVTSLVEATDPRSR
jgi:hypothetical protein